MNSNNYLVDGADNDEWLSRKTSKEKFPDIKLKPIKECGCSQYEHCQRCVEVVL